MPKKPANQTHQAAENENLSARIEKAEATLREILSGEADALFVSGVAGAQLFTLKGADQAYRTLIENMSEGALTLTPDGLVLYANRRFAGMLGMSLEKVIGSEIHTWFAPESRQVLNALLQIDTVDNRREELALAAADGTRVPVYLSVNRLHLVGLPDSLCMVATDLTEQKRNEAILAAEKLAHAILEQAADAIVICDETGRIIRASKEAQAFYGKDLIGQQFEHAFPLHQLDGSAFLPVGAVDTNRRQSVEARLSHNGQGFDFLVSVGHLKGARNELLGSVVTLTDITERKQVENALQESKNLLQLVMEHVPAHIFWKNRDLRYLGCNTQFAKDAGYSRPNELFGKTDFEMGWKDQAELYRADDKAILDSGVSKLNYIEPQTTPDGSTIWLRTSKVPLRDRDNRIIGVLGLFQDITTEKKAADELIESERRFSDLLENVELVSMMLDREGRITYCNEFFLRLTGWNHKEVIGKNWFELFVPTEIQDLKDVFFAALLDNQPEARHHENDILTRSGERRLIRWNNSVLRSSAGEVIGIASIGEDITEHKKAEQKFKALLESAPDAMVIVNAAAEMALVNSRAVELFGWRRDELLGHTIEMLMPERFRGTHTGNRGNFFAHPRVRAMGTGLELFGLRKDGTEFPLEISLSPLETDEGALVISAIRDITERKAAEAKILYLNRVHAVLSGINTLIVRVQDRDELFREACRIAVENGGFRMAILVMMDQSTMKYAPVASVGVDEELLMNTKDLLSSSEHFPDTMVALAVREKKAIVSNNSSNDARVLFGKKYTESGVRSKVILPLIVSDEAIGALALYAGEMNFFQEDEMKLLTELADDISFAIDHIDKQEKLNYLAYYDVLTGLANRTLFLERVAQYMRSAVSNGHKLAVCLIDLERFKNINDSLGRSTGDVLLKQVAEWLTNNTGDVNLLARIDADHFAMVLPEIRQEGDLIRLIEKMEQDFYAHPFRLNDADFRIAAKAGIAVFPDDGNDADILFKNAEAALKKAKAGGDRYLFYTQKMTEAVAGKLTLENQLRRAIDNEEFVLHYQPKLNLASGKVTSAEALIRWNDPRTGMVPPGKFIPILEETGLINEVGLWALHKAIADNLRWRSAGLPAVRIAVNVSALQLHRHSFIAEIEQAVAIDAHAAEGLELEITESLVMDDVERNIAILRAVRAMGITIAIDDFGTGFSSLSYLAKLPVTTLKIDRSFVIEMTAGPEGLALVSTIISLAHAFKLKVVAEGVETEEQSHLLSLLNCDEIQGFLFSKAVPCEEFETKFLAKQTPV